MEKLLSMHGIDKYFFGKAANLDVHLEVAKGEIHALLGENGAGKTTLMNILYGLYQCDAGEILWKGKPLAFRLPAEALAAGIGMVQQHLSLVPTLSVSENITLGQKPAGYPFTKRSALRRRILEASERYGLDIRPDALVSSLSLGEQQRVEIFKLLYREAELLILDEPTAVLTPGETHELFRILKALKKSGRSVIIITHRIPEVMQIADRVTVLRDARCILSAALNELTEEQLSKAMIGRELKAICREKQEMLQSHETTAAKQNEGGFVMQAVRCGGSKRNGSSRHGKHGVQNVPTASPAGAISLRIAPGEILAIAGVDGNGQKDLAEVILGIRPCVAGQILLDGRRIEKLDTRRRKRLGIAYISDDRHRDGLVLDMSVRENLLLRESAANKFVRHGLIRQKELSRACTEAIQTYQIKTPGCTTPIRLLSGGNQQKLILARELSASVRLIVAFQPTRGLDIGASEFIREQLLAHRCAGACVLLISADLEEIRAVSDRIAVIHAGEIMGIVRNDAELDLTKIGLMMAGRTFDECKGATEAADLRTAKSSQKEEEHSNV